MVGLGLLPREALAAPKDPVQIHIQSIVILVVSVLSMLGAGWIMASFAVFAGLRRFRHQLILGLAISDFIMAVNFLLSTSMNVSGHHIGAPSQVAFCSFNGFMTQVFVIQTDYWVLIIAVCTYLILAGHKRLSVWIQDHRLIVWVLPWLFSILWSSVGLGVAGYGDIGAWCWFTSDEVRLLVNFVPRWAIIALMLLLYSRLYFILFRAHRRFVSVDVESSNTGPRRNVRRPSRHVLPTENAPRILAEDNSFGEAEQLQVRPSRQSRKLKRLARLMLIYPLAYAVIWTLPTSIRIYQATTGRAAPWQLQTVDKACIVIQGFVDAVIYGINESSVSSWRALLFPQRDTLVIEGMASSSAADGATFVAAPSHSVREGAGSSTNGSEKKQPQRNRPISSRWSAAQMRSGPSWDANWSDSEDSLRTPSNGVGAESTRAVEMGNLASKAAPMGVHEKVTATEAASTGSADDPIDHVPPAQMPRAHLDHKTIHFE